MSALLDELTTRARALSPQEREALAFWLLDSVDEPATDTDTDAEVKATWDRVIAARIDALEAGEPTEPAERVHAKWRDRAA